MAWRLRAAELRAAPCRNSPAVLPPVGSGSQRRVLRHARLKDGRRHRRCEPVLLGQQTCHRRAKQGQELVGRWQLQFRGGLSAQSALAGYCLAARLESVERGGLQHLRRLRADAGREQGFGGQLYDGREHLLWRHPRACSKLLTATSAGRPEDEAAFLEELAVVCRVNRL